MARDLDFIVKRTAVRPIQSGSATVTSSTTKTNHSNTLLWTVLIILLVAAAIGIWQFTASETPSTSSVKTPLATNDLSPVPPPTTTKVDNSLLSPQTSSPLVQVYNSGAGSTAIASLVDKLKSLGYKVDNLDKSQFNYDRTYIRYRAGMQVEAEKIQSAMPDRLVSLKEVVSAGLFDILILLGNN